ncbi:PAS domain S-box protein [Tumidithrix helvetica PCC 7403]|uniref:PAS domain-containing sensor histidine kinase n=1 Tax=Tumidithrix helvetica TaxID=3457545 RepID=UPI003C88BC6C
MTDPNDISTELDKLPRDRLFRLIAENASDLIAVIDPQGYRIYNSPSYSTLLGYSASELQETWAYDKIHPDDQAKVLEVAQSTLATGVGKVLEYRMQHKDGSWRILESSGSVIRDPQGQVEYLMIVAHDITDRKWAEAALQLSGMRLRKQQQALLELTKHRALLYDDLKATLRVILETATRTIECDRVSIWLYKNNRTKIWCLDLYQSSNRSHASGVELERELGKELGREADPKNADFIEAIQLLIRPEGNLSSDRLPFIPDYIDTSITPTPTFRESARLDIPLRLDGQKVGTIIYEHPDPTRAYALEEQNFAHSIADIVSLSIEQWERRRTEKELRTNAISAHAQAQQLETALANLKHTQAQLIQNEKMSSLGQLVAGIAHEINNPVNFIHGNLNHASRYVQSLFELITLYQKHYPTPEPEIQQAMAQIDLEFLLSDLPKMLASMRGGADRIRQIVSSLRNFSRSDHDGKKPFDIHEGIDSTLMILQNRFKPYGDQKEITVIKEYGNLPQVTCLAGQINQVFMNILSNAIDALEEKQKQQAIASENQEIQTEAEPSTITIHTELRSNVSHPYVVIRIANNGIAIPQAAQSRLFDPFFTTKPVGQGTGLGLSISYQIVVEKHQGKLYFQSESNKGTEFIIELPVG